VRDGDLVQITVDRIGLKGQIDLVGKKDKRFDPEEGARVLAARPPHPGLEPAPGLPDDTRLWAALQNVSGGTWGGCVYDVDTILERLGGS
jgi:dihydroxyacid dehydratase/phosphogluconate dehydratase